MGGRRFTTDLVAKDAFRKRFVYRTGTANMWSCTGHRLKFLTGWEENYRSYSFTSKSGKAKKRSLCKTGNCCQ